MELSQLYSSTYGKHIDFVAPPNAGTTTFNHHERHSLVLMAMCDAYYRFTFVDIGSYGKNPSYFFFLKLTPTVLLNTTISSDTGSESDSTIFCESAFSRDLLGGNMNLPEEQALPMRNSPLYPFWIVADQAFPLSRHILRPYPGQRLTETQRVFNYR